MLLFQHYIDDSKIRLASIIKLIHTVQKKDEKEAEEVDNLISRSYSVLVDLAFALQEAAHTQSSHSHVSTVLSSLSVVKRKIKSVSDAKEDLELIASHLKFALDSIEEITGSFSTYSIPSRVRDLVFQSSTERVGMSSSVLPFIKKSIRPAAQQQALNVLSLSPDMTDVKDMFPDAPCPANFYAAGIPEMQRDTFAQIYSRLALGTLSGSVITNKAFDAVYVSPVISATASEMSTAVRNEKTELQAAARYLKEGGFLFFHLPFYRLYRDLALMLSKNFSDLQIRRLSGSSNTVSGKVLIVAKKRPNSDGRAPDPKVYQLLRSAFDVDSIPFVDDIPFDDIVLNTTPAEVLSFRGSILDPSEIKGLIKESDATRDFWEEEKKPVNSLSDQSPLLPFNTGQLGLVLTSGVLDGVIDETKGYYHAVKGRVVKRTDSNRDYVRDDGDSSREELRLQETTSNRVEINVFLGDGTYKTLA